MKEDTLKKGNSLLNQITNLKNELKELEDCIELGCILKRKNKGDVEIGEKYLAEYGLKIASTLEELRLDLITAYKQRIRLKEDDFDKLK